MSISVDIGQVGSRAVVVDAVIRSLVAVWVDGFVVVVAVVATDGLGIVSISVDIGQVGSRAVVVDAVIRSLVAVWVDGFVVVVAVVATDGLGIVSVSVDIGQVGPGAIVVDAVIWGLGAVWVDGFVVVVAVVTAVFRAGEPVAICIGERICSFGEIRIRDHLTCAESSEQRKE